MKHDNGATLCAELLEMSSGTIAALERFELGPFLERNSEKRVSVLLPMVREMWALLKPEILQVECVESLDESESSDEEDEEDESDDDEIGNWADWEDD